MCKSKTIAVVDGDEIAFVVAAACETRSISAQNSLSGQVSKFKHRTELSKFLKGLDVPDDFYKIEDVIVADDIANALHSVKVIMDNIKTACKAEVMEVYISGKDNFRDSIPLPTKYKSNRKDVVKPVLLAEVRAYLVKKYHAKVVDGVEVDDICAYRMWDGYKSQQKIIAVTQDKDVLSNMGWYYNRNNMTEPEFIEGLGELHINHKNEVKGRGRKWGYHQWLIGDSSDGYKPTELCGKRFGEKSSYAILAELETDRDCIQAVYNQYKEWYPNPITYTTWDGEIRTVDCISIMQMYMDCYRMRRWEGDCVNVSDLLTKLNINH